MRVETEFGPYEDLGPTRPNWTFRPPKPEFWTDIPQVAIFRGIARAREQCGRLRKLVNYSAVEFGWGDAGLSSFAVYQSIGKIRVETKQVALIVTVQFKHGMSFHDAIQVTATFNAKGYGDWDTVTNRILAALNMEHAIVNHEPDHEFPALKV